MSTGKVFAGIERTSVVEHNMFLNAKYHFENENHLYLKRWMTQLWRRKAGLDCRFVE